MGESCLWRANKDTMAIIQAEMEQQKEHVDKLEVLFNAIDTEHDGLVSLAEFRDSMDNPKMRAFVSSLGLHVDDAEYCFKLLSCNGEVGVDVEHLVEACIKMEGLARGIDVQDLLIRVKQACASTARMESWIKQCMPDGNMLAPSRQTAPCK